MTSVLALICLFAAVLSVGSGVLIAALVPATSGWLLDIIRLAVLLISYLWLRAVLGV